MWVSQRSVNFRHETYVDDEEREEEKGVVVPVMLNC